MQQDCHMRLINYLDRAMIPERGESAVIDFSAELLIVLRYAYRHRLAHKRVDLPLFICGEHRHAKATFCIINCSQRNDDIFLLVQAVKRSEHGEPVTMPVNASVHLVAKAVAAFNENNAQREANELPPFPGKVSHFCDFVLLAFS